MSDSPTHLIIVCCHGVWLGGPSRGANDEGEWLIADFQRGETGTFIQHTKAGVRCLAESQQKAALAFSGGATRPETEQSEAQSYANIASAHNFWGLLSSSSSDPDTILIEDRALDSYHNVLFSLALFRSRFDTWPSRLTVVSHGFKERRIVGHCAAIGYPPERVTFVGVDPPGMASGENEGAIRGAREAEDDWMADPHGRGEKLAGKRARRNPWGTWQGVFPARVEDDEAGKGGLVTRGEGEKETLVEGAPRPWMHLISDITMRM